MPSDKYVVLKNLSVPSPCDLTTKHLCKIQYGFLLDMCQAIHKWLEQLANGRIRCFGDILHILEVFLILSAHPLLPTPQSDGKEHSLDS